MLRIFDAVFAVGVVDICFGGRMLNCWQVVVGMGGMLPGPGSRGKGEGAPA